MKNFVQVRLTKGERSLLSACTGKPTTPADARTLLACRHLVKIGYMASERECVLVDPDDSAIFIDNFWTTRFGLHALRLIGGAA